MYLSPHCYPWLFWSHTNSSVFTPYHFAFENCKWCFCDRPWVGLLHSSSQWSIPYGWYLWSSPMHSLLLAPLLHLLPLTELINAMEIWDHICILFHFSFSWYKFLKDFFLSIQNSELIMIFSYMFIIVLFLCINDFNIINNILLVAVNTMAYNADDFLPFYIYFYNYEGETYREERVLSPDQLIGSIIYIFTSTPRYWFYSMAHTLAPSLLFPWSDFHSLPLGAHLAGSELRDTHIHR